MNAPQKTKGRSETRPTVKIWGRASAFNVQKALWALGEVGVTFERIDIGGPFGGLDEPAFAALNPNKRIPVLEDDGTIVWESNAIIRYLAANYAEGTLWHPDPGLRSEADRWMAWMQTTLYRDFIDLFWGVVRSPPEKQDPDRLAALARRLARHYRILDQHLSAQPYVAGESFTMGDIPAGTTLYRYFEMDIERPALPHLEAWYARLCERPAYAAHIMRPFDELKGREGF